MTRKPAAVPAGPPDIGIGKLLRRAHGAFSREFRNRLAEHGVTFGEFIHLEKLWEEDGLNQTEISRRVEITTASSTQIIETLEQRGFIVRKRNPDDRRNLNVFLRPAGRRIEVELLECARSTNRAARAGLSGADTIVLFDLIERIIANLESRADAAKKSGGGRSARGLRKPGR